MHNSVTFHYPEHRSVDNINFTELNQHLCRNTILDKTWHFPFVYYEFDWIIPPLPNPHNFFLTAEHKKVISDSLCLHGAQA